MTDQSIANVETVVRSIAESAIAREVEFGDLDAVVGDGDFGYSLARGFEKVIAEWDNYDRTDASTFLAKVALTVTSRIGGTSGPIWGTALLRAGMAVKGKQSLDGEDAVEMLRAAAEGIKTRGNSDVGDKTLLDALVPATDALSEALAKDAPGSEALATMAAAARTAADATSQLEARRGRASYSGERSIGSPDAGAVAIALMLEDLLPRWNSHT
ncbi:dihydroxyacetone kinase subunit DhaL [Brachybacterium sp. UNK5269]|uniref:dihydroxyacetone kinase subunit DhaL n=1 Tax=Brachybacterium sp. UNK5269 TaxID=3408576 RepID=UPI003BAF18A4